MNLIKQKNARILERLSLFLNLMPDAIDAEQLNAICEKNYTDEERNCAYGVLLSAYCSLDTESDGIDRDIFRSCFCKMVKKQNIRDYSCDAYFKNISFPEVTCGNWEMKKQSFKPYEAFLVDETDILRDGSILPNIGYFEEEFYFPAVLQNGREWMTVTPHEINSTKSAVNECFGNVATYGLGLGYFTYLASMKENVKSVTVAELDASAISLFEKYILPQFEHREKIKIVHTDAFDFAQKHTQNSEFDYVFADTWHDPSDGVQMYKRFKALENNAGTRYSYWIEKTLKYYMTLNSPDDFVKAPFGI